MRRQTVTREQVFEAADQIVDMGLNPTQNAVIRRVGGSFSTVGRYMEEWRRVRRAANENPTAALPEQLDGAAKAFAGEIWAKALELMTARLRDDQKRLEVEQLAIDEDRIDMLNMIRDMEDAAVVQGARIEALEKSARDAEAGVASLKDKIAKAHERAVVAEARLGEANRRVEELLENIAQAHQRNVDLLQSLLSTRRRGHARSR